MSQQATAIRSKAMDFLIINHDIRNIQYALAETVTNRSNSTSYIKHYVTHYPLYRQSSNNATEPMRRTANQLQFHPSLKISYYTLTSSKLLLHAKPKQNAATTKPVSVKTSRNPLSKIQIGHP